MMNKKIKAAITTLLIITAIVLLAWKTNNQEVNETIPVILYSDSAQNYALHGEKCVLHMEGTVEKRLLLPDVFEGVIWLEGMEEMKRTVKVAGGFRIEDNVLEYVYQDGQSEQSVKLIWNEGKALLALQFMPRERNEEWLDAFLAVGPCESVEEVEECLKASAFPTLYTKVISYEKASLQEMLQNDTVTGFSFGTIQPGRTTEAELKELYPQLAEEEVENLAGADISQWIMLTAGAAKPEVLAMDLIQFSLKDGVVEEIAFAFRFRDKEQLQEAYEVFLNGLEAFEISNIEVQQYLDGRSCYAAPDGTMLELVLNERKLRFDVSIR